MGAAQERTAGKKIIFRNKKKGIKKKMKFKTIYYLIIDGLEFKKKMRFFFSIQDHHHDFLMMVLN
jgi:hypothetical protein